MKRKLLIILFLIGIYFLASNFPKYSNTYKNKDLSISTNITENILTFKDPEYTKHIIIQDKKETLKLKYWSESYNFKIYRRQNNKESFWVIEDYFRGVTRSKNGEFSEFICPDCSGIENTVGINEAEYSFENDKLIQIEKNSNSIITEKSKVEHTSLIEKPTPKISKKTYELGEIQVELTQAKSNGNDYYCKSKLVTLKDNEQIDSIVFISEPVGGNYGISKPKKIGNHLVFTKHGDYDGRTILINEEGNIFNIIGGENYYDKEMELLFTIYESDFSGFAVFNLYNDSRLMNMPEIEDRPISFHKDFNERYFILCENEGVGESDKSVWEIEFELDRIMQVELDTNQINKSNILKTWKVEDVKCKCEN